jgi:hypothetical protein
LDICKWARYLFCFCVFFFLVFKICNIKKDELFLLIPFSTTSQLATPIANLWPPLMQPRCDTHGGAS